MDVNLWLLSMLFTFLFANGENTVWLTGNDSRTPPTLACGGVDLVFLVDTSRSIWDPDFKRQIDFVDKVVSKFDIGPGKHQTRVGVILYAHTFWVRFYLRQYLDMKTLRGAIQNIPHKHGSKTRTEKALRFLRTHMFRTWYGGRKNATHVAIVISDGRSQHRQATRTEAIKAKEAGIKLFTIGVGRRAVKSELEEIASDPSEYFVFKVDDFKALDGLNYKLPTSTCDEPTDVIPAGTITTRTTLPPRTRTDTPLLSSTLSQQDLRTTVRNGADKTSSTVIQEYGGVIDSNNILHNIIIPTITTSTTDKNTKLFTAQNGLIGLTKEAIDIIQSNVQDSLGLENTIDLSNPDHIVGIKPTQKTPVTDDVVAINISDDLTVAGNNVDDDEEEDVQLNNNLLNMFTTTAPKPIKGTNVSAIRTTPTADITTTRLDEFLQGFTTTQVPQGLTTTISNEILQGLAAYSIKPITDDQAQIMSNYLLRDVPAQTYCDGKDADIYFVLDSSNSIWPEDFKRQLSFVNNMMDILDVTHGNTRVGVVVYSTHIYPIVMIDSGLTKRQIKRQVNAIKYVSGRTNTSDALAFVRQYGFAPALTRKGAVKLAIVLTDGLSRDQTETKAESERCREDNINLFAVGIGKHVDPTELKRIANDPDQKFMFHVESYAALNSIKDFLAITACSVVPDQPLNKLPICSGLGPMDVIFSYDAFALGSRKSQMINFFIHDILNSLDFSNGNLMTGRVTDNCPEFTNIPLSAGKNLSAFSSTRYPGIPSLLQKMNSSFSNREDAKKLGILFVDDSTEGIERAIPILKSGLDFKLMVIGIGDQLATEAAGDLCSYPKHDYFLQVPKYSSLLRARSKLLDKLCTSMIAAG